jgi:pre-mRNA-splicing factor CWC26
MASGHSAGLQSGRQFQEKEDALKREKEEEFASSLGSGGQGATVHRGKDGRKLDVGQHLAEQAEIERAAKLAEERELAEFRKGAAQKEGEAARRVEMEALRGEGLARYAGDERLERELKGTVRADDPMAKYMAKKVTAAEDKAGVVRKRVYRGPAPPPNRYGIRPGYRWDGVDRGNGFEAKVLARHAGQGLKREQAYKWSSSDM